jgi:hypothetical protein
MLHRLQLTLGQWLVNPNARRAVLILGTLAIAALVGGAPEDYGGGG